MPTTYSRPPHYYPAPHTQREQQVPHLCGTHINTLIKRLSRSNRGEKQDSMGTFRQKTTCLANFISKFEKKKYFVILIVMIKIICDYDNWPRLILARFIIPPSPTEQQVLPLYPFPRPLSHINTLIKRLSCSNRGGNKIQWVLSVKRLSHLPV